MDKSSEAKREFDIKKHLTELNAKIGISPSKIFNHQETGDSAFFNGMYAWWHQELSREKRFKIHPASFFVSADFEVNAWATKYKEHHLIALNIGLIEALKNLFMSQGGAFSKPEPYSSLEKAIEWPLQAEMFEWALKFVFLHETGHLIQLSCGADFTVDEKYAMAATSENFSHKHHIYEIDADSYAGLILGREIGILWGSVSPEKQTEENFYRLCICGFTTVFLVFLCLQNPYPDIFYKKGDHPHTFVRTVQILQHVQDGIGRTMQNSKIDLAEKVISDTLDLTDLFLKQSGQPGVNLSLLKIAEHIIKVRDYIEEVIYAEAKNYPALIVNQKQRV